MSDDLFEPWQKLVPIVMLGRRLEVPENNVLLRQLQRGDPLLLPHSRPMPSIGRRVHELRVPDADVTWRIVYRLDADAIVIGEVFAKKSAQTPQLVITTCQKRFKAYDAATRES